MKKVINFYYNSDIKNMLAVPAFDGKAGSYVIRSDGRIVINRTMGKGEPQRFLRNTGLWWRRRKTAPKR